MLMLYNGIIPKERMDAAMSCTTKTVMADALRELMRKRPVSKITVGDICEQCGMNRKSFYYHFHDKYDLINWIFRKEYSAAAESAPQQDRLLTLCNYLMSEHAFYRAALQPLDGNRLVPELDEALRGILYARLSPVLSGTDAPELTACVIGCRSVIISWLQAGCGTTANALVRTIYRAGGLMGRMSC